MVSKMPAYKYKARDKLGKAMDGVMDAPSSEMVASQLEGVGNIPVFIQEKKQALYL